MTRRGTAPARGEAGAAALGLTPTTLRESPPTLRGTPPTLGVEDVPADGGFRRLDALAGILVDLRYAGTNNFAGRNLYGALDCAWLRAPAAQGLEAAAAWLAARRPGSRLLVLDALRPHRVQEAIWRDVAGTPMAHYFADPAHGSVHSHGMAVDVTIVDAAGRESDMGTGYDEMTRASHPEHHAELLASGALSAAQVAERELLRAAMQAGGYGGIASEWWHFNHGDPARVRRDVPRVV